MVIAGNTRILTNTAYTYVISGIKGTVKPKEWRVEYNGKIIGKNTTGILKFHSNLAGKTVKLTAVVLENGKEHYYSINLIILLGTPKILLVEWQDSYGKPIGKRKVGYLDKIKLCIKTINIPKGDTLKISVFEDETISDRPMGTYTSSGVNDKGYAYLYFNHLSLYQTKLNDADWVNESEHEYFVKVEYKNHISQVEEKIQLVVQNELTQKIDKPKATNMPVVVGKVESQIKNKKAINFTFGIFLDGTLNNMYNTELRKIATGIAQSDTSGLSVGSSSGQIYKSHGDEKKLLSSYENDLSNPAILFKNYKKSEPDRIFKVYTEGAGTNTSPISQGGALNAKDYKDDDIVEGSAFGMGTAGIMDRVRKAIRDTSLQLQNILKQQAGTTTGTITFDVFGFSRGAAAARHFVHVVTQGPYAAKTTPWKEGVYVKDKFGYDLGESYAYAAMPEFGYLGQLLTEAKLMDAQMKVVIRFVGIYDTVPHYGLFQWNDISDLGLNDVNRANYVVHITAADEHRANFSLVDISSVVKTSPDSGKKGGIELAFPGVHCDVGGAYEEGRPDNPKRIDATIFESSLEPLRDDLINKGWFYPDEITIVEDIFRLTVNNYRLEGKRAKVSNQYSYIPLHIMTEFCGKKNIPIDKAKLIKFKNFKSNWIDGNVRFLESIQSRLHSYSFDGAAPYVFLEPDSYTEPPIVYDSKSPSTSVYIAERNQRQIDGDKRMKAEADKKNEYIKFLRNHYLHWNSTYGQSAKDTLVQANYPNKVNGIRKRLIR